MITTGMKKLDELLFGRGREYLVDESKEQTSKPRELDNLEEITLTSNGEFKCSNRKKIKATIIGLQSVTTPINYMRDELVLKEIKKFRDSLYQEANAYTTGSPIFFNNTKPVDNCFAKEGDYMCIPVLYCRI